MRNPNNQAEPLAGDRIVYVRAMRPDELPAEHPKTTLFGIHDEAGNRIGIAAERELAFAAARQNELTPVSVH